MTAGSVRWGANHSAAFQSIEELDAILDRLAIENGGDKAVLAEVTAPNGNSLSIGLGRDESVLNFVPGSGDPPYYTSVGDTSADGMAEFYCSGEWAELPARHLIPLAKAREAMREFVRTGQRSKEVAWEED